MPWMEWYDSTAKPGCTPTLATIVWMILAIWPYYRWIAVVQAPYFIWVSLAPVLQLSMTWMNWGR